MRGRCVNIGCPNPFDVELSPDMVQLGRRLSQEIANIQNSLEVGALAEAEASLPATGGGPDVRLPAKTRDSTPLPLVEPMIAMNFARSGSESSKPKKAR